MSAQDLAAVARQIVDSNLYMTLGTADARGRPWVAPVYYASADRIGFHWVSSPDATHSRNLAVRPEVSIVIGGSAWGSDDVRPPALHRLYRATATEHSVLDPSVPGVDRRTPVAI